MSDLTLERAAWCALNTLFGFQPMTGHAIVRTLGCAAAAFLSGRNALRDRLGPAGCLSRLGPQALDEAAESLYALGRQGVRFVTFADDAYPALLRECEDPPLGLYVRGGEDLFPPKREAVAVVGTRDLSPYGDEWTRKIVAALAASRARPVIVSGLALGTDAVAHRTALDCGLPTVGVLATGIDRVYPSRHTALAARIAALPDGGLITDFPPGSPPLPVHFLRRNRIIAGLCRATVLVESKIRGGGMLTARLAASYNRDVYVLPGRADDLRSAGCNRLLREKIAEPLTDPADIPAQLGLGPALRSARRDLPAELRHFYGETLAPEETERLILLAGLIHGRRGIGTEELCRESGLPYPAVAAGVGRLAADGIIATDLFGNCFIKPKKV